MFVDVVGVAASQCADQGARRARTPAAMAEVLRRRPNSMCRKTTIHAHRKAPWPGLDVRIDSNWKKSCACPWRHPDSSPLCWRDVGNEISHGVAPCIRRGPAGRLLPVQSERGWCRWSPGGHSAKARHEDAAIAALRWRVRRPATQRSGCAKRGTTPMAGEPVMTTWTSGLRPAAARRWLPGPW